jgi:hypothetical protein
MAKSSNSCLRRVGVRRRNDTVMNACFCIDTIYHTYLNPVSLTATVVPQLYVGGDALSHLSKSYFAYCNFQHFVGIINQSFGHTYLNPTSLTATTANERKPAWRNTGHTYLNPTSLTAT